MTQRVSSKMKRNKLAGIMLFGFIFILASSLIAFNGVTWSDEVDSCSCHSIDSRIVVTSLNSTSVNVAYGANFTLSFYVSSTVGGGGVTLLARFLDSSMSLTFTPSMYGAFQGIEDGDSNDPDGTANDQIGNSGNPVNIVVSNVPSTNASILITIVAVDDGPTRGEVVITVNVGAGGELPETPWEWFMRTQLPIITAIVILFGVGLLASFLTKKK